MSVCIICGTTTNGSSFCSNKCRAQSQSMHGTTATHMWPDKDEANWSLSFVVRGALMVVTYDGKVIRTYRDGVEVGIPIRRYDRALTDQEIWSQYKRVPEVIKPVPKEEILERFVL